jgi:hypothetical protein
VGASRIIQSIPRCQDHASSAYERGLKRNIRNCTEPNATRAAKCFADFTRTGLKGTIVNQVAPAIATPEFPARDQNRLVSGVKASVPDWQLEERL